MGCNLSVFLVSGRIVVRRHLTGKPRLTPQFFHKPEVHFKDYIEILKPVSHNRVQE